MKSDDRVLEELEAIRRHLDGIARFLALWAWWTIAFFIVRGVFWLGSLAIPWLQSLKKP